ncbi:probable DNA double-strand break repair Rad50 ATPase [Uranotaenia lowii]|uniref:probable DNA double-strand break repair Rad50 ATPase n=1 Tax=Uranotaenia lowii TaxID=190385 RepID=UPI00247AC7A6|nr:probable DNA double-strand break repair Rad50 ATPase [Uranotaenia lowii]
MTNATFIEDWNSIIQHKIKAADLEHPTESFVCRCLVSFLRMLKYDVTEFEQMYSETKDSIMQKRTLLVAHINHLYQLCLGPQQNHFFLMDLIKPSPKKTVHVLGILLNFLFYVNMVHDEVVKRATTCTSKFQELSTRMNQHQRDLESHRIKQDNIEHNINMMEMQLPQLERENEQLKEKQIKLREKSTILKTADLELVERIAKLDTDYATLKDQRVEDEEAAALIQKIEELDLDINECEKQETRLQQTNSEYATLISQIQPSILIVTEILQSPLDNCLSTIHNELNELKLNYSRLEKEHTTKSMVLESLQKNCSTINAYLDDKTKELAAKQKAKRKTERQTMSDLSSKKTQLEELQEQNENHLETIEVLKEEISLILQMAEKTFKLLMRNS